MPRPTIRECQKPRNSARQAKSWPFIFTGLLMFIIPTTNLLKALHDQRWNSFISWQIFLSLISFISYGFDKYRAITAGWRIRENALLLVDALGGWPGGFAAQYCFRHKIRKKFPINILDCRFTASNMVDYVADARNLKYAEVFWRSKGLKQILLLVIRLWGKFTKSNSSIETTISNNFSWSQMDERWLFLLSLQNFLKIASWYNLPSFLLSQFQPTTSGDIVIPIRTAWKKIYRPVTGLVPSSAASPAFSPKGFFSAPPRTLPRPFLSCLTSSWSEAGSFEICSRDGVGKEFHVQTYMV